MVDHLQLDDADLLRLIAYAQESALGSLYDRYGRLVYSLAYNAVGDVALAEEITQDVFLRIWEKAETYRVEQGKVVTWLASITRNRAIDLYRRRSVRPEGNRVPWDLDTGPDLQADTDVEGEVEIARRKQVIRQALAELPAEQRLALSYAYFQGYSHREIAEHLNEPLGTVKTRIRLAMQKLRVLLEEHGLLDG